MDLVTHYLFGFERHATCNRCPGAVYVVALRPADQYFNAWHSCPICSPGMRAMRAIKYWYYR